MAAPKELDNLTDKQRRFCEEYVIDWNATRAAKAAGYSEDSARQVGSENLSKPYIQAYIEEIQKDLSKLCGVSAAMLINELKKIAFSSAADLREDWSNEKKWEDLTDDEKAILAEIQVTKKRFGNEEAPVFEEMLKYKTYDKQKAIDQLAKMLGYNAPEKHEHSGSIQFNVPSGKSSGKSDTIE